MTRVDFYILDSAELSDRLSFVNRLVSKTARLGHYIRVQVNSEAEALSLLDSMLNHDKFACLPIGILEMYPAEQTLSQLPNIQISYSEQDCHHHDLLVNLTTQTPSFFASFDRLAEVVIQDEDVLQSTRQAYRFYQSKNYPLHQHKISIAA